MITIIITSTVYSRDLRHKETMMMELMMKLPDDMFRLELLPYLTVDDIVKLDNACMNHEYRYQLIEKIYGVILLGDKDESMTASLFKWLGIRRIYWINMNLLFRDDNFSSSNIKYNYVDQFRYTQHVFMRGPIRDIMAIFIISHSPCLLSIDISESIENSSLPQITDHTLQSIAEHCTGLQSLSLKRCREITDAGVITISNLKSFFIYNCYQITDVSIISISTQCTGLQSLHLEGCSDITDASIISISTHCTGLQSLDLGWCDHITDASIISISTHCTGIQSLKLQGCHRITDTSIISISIFYTGLQSLDLGWCNQITDASIISISYHCTGLQSLNLVWCYQITDASIIPISEICTGLKTLDVFRTAITDASLIAIAKNCTGLQLLDTYRCDGLSSKKLRRSFKSVSELRAVLLSIYPSPPRLTRISSCTIH